jgi:predicted dehydrogenase
MKNSLKVGLVGCGYWGPNHIRNFCSLAEVDIKRVCDLDIGRLSYIKQIYPGIETTTVFEDILNDRRIEAVVIATPVHSHFKLAKQSLLAGKHILVEKPMASSVPECQELIRLAERQKRIIMVGHTFIYSAPVQAMKKFVDSEYLGEIFYISSQRLNLGLFQKDINVAWDLAPHDISIILYILGQDPTAVNCQGKAHVNGTVEDITTMTLEFPDNAFAIVQSSWLDPNKIRKMTVVGSKRMVVYDDTEPLEKIKIYDKHVEVPPHYDSFAEFNYSYHYGDVHIPYIKQVEPLKVQCQHFVDCIRTNSKPESSGLEGMRVVQILEAASSSLKAGGAKVPFARPLSPSHEALLSLKQKAIPAAV